MTASTALFSPSWDCQEVFAVIGQPPLGSLVSIMDRAVVQQTSDQSDIYTTLIESCLYIIISHYVIFTTAVDLTLEEEQEVKTMKSRLHEVLSGQAVSRVQRNIKVSLIKRFRIYF